jgi:hypothetical protein
VNNLQDTLLFPFQDAEARKQFLFACLVAFAGFIIPIIPMVVLTGYSAKIMRQIIEERKKPSMPDWQSSDWSDMFMDGLRIYGAQLVLMLPIIVIMGVAVFSMLGGSIAVAISQSDGAQAAAPFGIFLFMAGFAFIMLFTLLALPYGVIVSAVGPHVAVTRSFESAFQVRKWWDIFRKGLGQFVLAYVIMMLITWVFTFVLQFAMLTVVLFCIVPFIMIPYTAYAVLIRNSLNVQAYTAGIDNQKAEHHAAA